RDCELPFGIDELDVKPPDVDALRALYARLELFSLIRRRLPEGAAAAGEPIDAAPDLPRDYVTVLTEAELDAWIERIEAADLVSLDTETNGLDYMRCDLVGLSVSVAENEAAYIPVAHTYPGAPEQLD